MGAPGWWESKHLALAAFTTAFPYDLAPMGVASRFAAKWLKSKIAHAADGQPLGSISSNLAGVLLVTPQRPPGGLDGYLKRKEAR